jgi:hypothetical protein
LARNFATRLLTNEGHPLHAILGEIISWRENPVNVDRVDTIPLIEANNEIIPKVHLIGRGPSPLCCRPTFTSIMSSPRVEIDRGTDMATARSSFGPFSRRSSTKPDASSRMAPNQ